MIDFWYNGIHILRLWFIMEFSRSYSCLNFTGLTSTNENFCDTLDAKSHFVYKTSLKEPEHWLESCLSRIVRRLYQPHDLIPTHRKTKRRIITSGKSKQTHLPPVSLINYWKSLNRENYEWNCLWKEKLIFFLFERVSVERPPWRKNVSQLL